MTLHADRAAATLCVHGPGRPTEARAPLVPPIVRSSVFLLDDDAYAQRVSGRSDRALVYARETNPTVEALEAHVAALEGAERTLAFSSGMAAIHATCMALLSRGDRLVAFRQLYGGSLALFEMLLPRLGVELSVVDVNDMAALESVLDEKTRMVFCESISNPLTAVADVPAVAELLRAQAPRASLVVDATLASPVGQRPLALGADLAFHSATKYLGGHSDLIAGVLSGSDELLQRIWSWRTRAGGCIDPEAAYLVLRGMRTLALRMRAHAEGAQVVGRFLAEHPRVAAVHYCAFEAHPSHAVAGRLLENCGGLLSFEVADGDEAALAMIRRLYLFAEAASLGGVESLASRPRDLSHVHLSPEERERAGIVPGLVRLAVGIEDPADLVADLEQALG